MSVNLAGCGGGGSGNGTPVATPTTQKVTFRLQSQTRVASNGGTITLTGPVQFPLTATANSRGVATLASVTPGTYTVTFVVNDNHGKPLSTDTITLVITNASGQTYLLRQGLSPKSSNFAITNNSGTAEPAPLN